MKMSLERRKLMREAVNKKLTGNRGSIEGWIHDIDALLFDLDAAERQRAPWFNGWRPAALACLLAVQLGVTFILQHRLDRTRVEKNWSLQNWTECEARASRIANDCQWGLPGHPGAP